MQSAFQSATEVTSRARAGVLPLLLPLLLSSLLP